MNQPGFGVMLHYLSGGSEHSASEYYGRQIISAGMSEDRLNIGFSDGAKIAVWDDGQSCCENRYMTTDDGFVTVTTHNEHNGYYGGLA